MFICILADREGVVDVGVTDQFIVRNAKQSHVHKEGRHEELVVVAI